MMNSKIVVISRSSLREVEEAVNWFTPNVNVISIQLNTVTHQYGTIEYIYTIHYTLAKED